MSSAPIAQIDPTYQHDTLRRVTWRLIPFMMLLYFIAFLDRVNVGFAALTMNRDIGLTDKIYGMTGAFFLGYFLFEVPSNLLLDRYGARRWISRIMISWGLVSAAMALACGTVSYLSLRVALGVAEAGFFPGMILYLTYWFPAATRARMTALFVAAIPISSVLGLPISGQIMRMEGIWGLHGWQWLFILEGLPAVLIGAVVPFLLTDRPANARWLKDQQKRWLQETLDAESHAKPHMPLLKALVHPSILALSAVYFCLMIGLYVLSFWMPKVMKAAGDLSDTQVSLLGVVPYAAGAMTMFFWGRHSDASGEHEWHSAFAMAAAAVGLAMIAFWTKNLVGATIGFSLVSVGVFCAMSTFWPLPSARLRGTAAAGGIAVVNSVGNLGGFVGPAIIGEIQRSRLGFAGGFWATAGFLVLGAVLVIATKTARARSPHVR